MCMLRSLGWAALGTGFTFLMTTLGAAMVFFLSGEPKPRFQKAMLGFAAGVMLLGVVFLAALDAMLPRLRREKEMNDAWRQNTLLMTAITLHNVPEGMAVGLAFALAAAGEGAAGAMALALGIGGMLSGAVEPVFGILVVLIAAWAHPMMPWLLSFAAGAMLYVVVEELVPQAHSRAGTCGFVGGFLIMMVLDVALG